MRDSRTFCLGFGGQKPDSHRLLLAGELRFLNKRVEGIEGPVSPETSPPNQARLMRNNQPPCEHHQAQGSENISSFREAALLRQSNKTPVV